MEAESIIAKISLGECAAFHETDIFRTFCEEFVKLEEVRIKTLWITYEKQKRFL